jgi:hypothetical protein
MARADSEGITTQDDDLDILISDQWLQMGLDRFG